MSISFLVTSLIVIVSPGTGVLYTLAAALSRGSRASVAAAFGCTLGIVPHMSAAMLGLAAVLHTSALAFAALKWCGVIYLLYMAWQALRERGALAIEPRLDARSAGRVIVTGFLINILNPKLSIFFLAFLPQFIAADEGHPLLKMLELSGAFMAMTFAVFVVYGLFAAFVRDRIVTRPKAMTWLRRVFAGGFAALGAKLAFAERCVRLPNSRHCEPTGRANARPMTGSAKQSTRPQSKSGLLRRCAPRNDGGVQWRNQKGGRRAGRLIKLFSGNAGCPGGAGLHPGLKVTSWTSSSTLTSSPSSPSSLS
jgi:threonine/homoserine/homoserine lactone efflux protein